MVYLFQELSDEQLETVVGGTTGGLISLNAPLFDAGHDNQFQGIGGQVQKTPISIPILSNANTSQGILGLGI